MVYCAASRAGLGDGRLTETCQVVSAALCCLKISQAVEALPLGRCGFLELSH